MAASKKAKAKTEKKRPELTDPASVEEPLFAPLDTKLVVSTGSTLLDLAISGNRIRGGGLPGGILVEIYGPSSSGKTCLLTEICASIQDKGGDVFIADPEARLDKEYAALFGLKIPRDIYCMPNTVSELYKKMDDWFNHKRVEGVISAFAADSIAALSTEWEMEGKDARGQRKAKELSELCRKLARKIANKNQIVLFTNQERQGDYGKTTPGGFAVPYHSSLRIRICRAGQRQITLERTTETKVEVSKVIGIESKCTITKSSIGGEFQEAPIYIVTNHGIDDIRANLVWLKRVMGTSKFQCVDKEYPYINQAVNYIEKNNLEAQLRDLVIAAWEEIDQLLKIKRKKKVRF